MNKYSYNGPVMIFDKCVQHRFRGETMANSEQKARSNLVYQYKTKSKIGPGSHVTLPGKIELIE